MKSGFIILFLEIFGVQLCNFLLSVKSEIAYIFLLIQSFLLLFIYRHLYLLVKQSLKNAQQEAEFQSLQKQEQLQKDQEQLFISRRQETLAFQQATIQNLQTLQTYLKSGEYDKIQNYLPAITDNFQKERFHPICHDSLINAILADKRFLALQKNVKISYEILLPEKSCISSSEPFISVTSRMSAGFLTIHMRNSKDPAQTFDHKTSKSDIVNHGFGLSIIEDICTKNDGSCQWLDHGDSFDSIVMLRYQ